MDEATYCREKCKGQCCYLRLPEEGEPVRCPQLKADCSCGVYAERYREGQPDVVVVGYWSSRRIRELDGRPAQRPFPCGRIHQIHAAGGLPKAIADQCCQIHPELLIEEQ